MFLVFKGRENEERDNKLTSSPSSSGAGRFFSFPVETLRESVRSSPQSSPFHHLVEFGDPGWPVSLSRRCRLTSPSVELLASSRLPLDRYWLGSCKLWWASNNLSPSRSPRVDLLFCNSWRVLGLAGYPKIIPGADPGNRGRARPLASRRGYWFRIQRPWLNHGDSSCLRNK